MTLHLQMRPLLAQFTNATGRGNLVVANETLVQIVEKLIEKLDEPPAPCANCQCGSKSSFEPISVSAMPPLDPVAALASIAPVAPVAREPASLIADDVPVAIEPAKPAPKPRRKTPAKTTRKRTRTTKPTP